MKQLKLLFFIFYAVAANGQLITDTSYTIEEYVEDIFLGGGVDVSNVTYTGDKRAIGNFYGSTNIGLKTGLIISSGFAKGGPEGPNNTEGYSENLLQPGDVDLEKLYIDSLIKTNDAFVLEFDFIASSDSVSFRYVFASEEYPEFVCSEKNDVFGFFLSGPGISGPYSNNSKNIATLPDGTPVAINYVNGGLANGLDSCILTNSSYYVDNNNGSTIQYDGFTTVLTAKHNVTCGKTYHIKIAIADGDDNVYDSGIFLEAKSFKSGKYFFSPNVSYSNTVNQKVLFEGCGYGTINFIRSLEDTASSDTLLLTIGGTAVNDSDYTHIPDTVIFLAGQDSVAYIFNPIQDSINEGDETLIITMIPTSQDSCEKHQIVRTAFKIREHVLMDLIINNDTSLCKGEPVNIVASVSGGVPPYTYIWSNMLDSVPFHTLYPDTSSSYSVKIKDACNTNEPSDTINIHIPQAPPLSLTTSKDTSVICPVKPIQLYASASGGFPPYFYSWSNGTYNNSTIVAPSSNSIYTVSITDSCGTKLNSNNIKVKVVAVPLSVKASNDTILKCPGIGVPISAKATGSIPDSIFSYTWDNNLNTGQSHIVAPEIDTWYYVFVSDACGEQQLAKDSVLVKTIPYPFLKAIAWGDTSICPGKSIILNSTSEGGVGKVSYSWAPSPGNPAAYNPSSSNTKTTALISGYYTITISDSCNTKAFDTLFVNVYTECPITIPNIITPNNDSKNETLIIKNIDLYPDNKLEIYNRWGTLIYQSKNYSNNWDAAGITEGTYYYILYLNDSSPFTLKGFITVTH